jgi:hypothetical protein
MAVVLREREQFATPRASLLHSVMQSRSTLIEPTLCGEKQVRRKLVWHFSQSRGERPFRPLEDVLKNLRDLFPRKPRSQTGLDEVATLDLRDLIMTARTGPHRKQ